MQPVSPASAEVTPMKKATVVMPALPGSQGPGSLEKKARPATDPNFGQLDAEEIAELVRGHQTMKAALKDVMTAGGGGAALTHFMREGDHGDVVGMIESGGVSPPGAQ